MWIKQAPAAAGFIISIVLVSSLPGGPLTNKGTQPGLTYSLLPTNSCSNCHGNDYDPDDDLEPYNTWAGSMMAQATRDPLFWAALDVANNDFANAGDFCLRCHTPAAWLAGRSEPPGGSVDGCGLVGQLDAPNNDFDGLTCHFCHRMYENPAPPPGEDGVYFDNGQFWVDDQACPGGNQPCRRGPYDYNEPGMTAPPGNHPWVRSTYHTTSGLCGNCHNVSNPIKNLIIDGTDQGTEFPIERTYKEWQQSDYPSAGTSCQSCHMPESGADPAYACSQQSNDHTGELAVHRFAGGNAWIPDVLRLEYPNLGLDDELIAARDAAIDMLQNQSATVEVSLLSPAVEGHELFARVRVTNLTGHKLPTGYPEGRRMWLNVEARDALNTLVFESGAYDSVTAELTHDAQAKIYQVEPGIWNYNGTGECDHVDGVGKEMFHFMLNDCFVSDNRIPPLGFTGMNDAETRPKGYTYPETSPGSGILVNYDETDYLIPVPMGTPSPITVTATLRYQTASKEYVEFLYDESIDNGFPDDCIERSDGFPTKSRAELLLDMWNNYGKSAPVDMGTDDIGAAVVAPTPGEASRGAQMLVTGFDSVSGQVDLSYDPACSATDHTLYVGDLAQVAGPSFSSQECSLGPSGSAGFTAGPGDLFWVVVGHDGANEGSYGTNHAGVERAEDTALTNCNHPQDLARRCDP